MAPRKLAADNLVALSYTDDPAVEPPFEFNPKPLRELMAEVDDAGEPRWLINGIWPEGDYGVMAAPSKAGKGWIALDLAFAVATDGKWLGLFGTSLPGPVLVFAGEGGERKMVRRFRGIAAFYGADDSGRHGDDIHIEERVPHLGDMAQLAALKRQIERIRPVLVIVDPLYLAARGANSASLVDMGAMLEGIQRICQQHGAALLIVHHYNKTGAGSGAHRMSGAGAAEWGRLLITVEVKGKVAGVQPRSTDATLIMEITGDEGSDRVVKIARKLWATDPDRLSSPLNYVIAAHEIDQDELKQLSVASPADGLTGAAKEVYGVLVAASRGGEPKLNIETIRARTKAPNPQTGLETLTREGVRRVLRGTLSEQKLVVETSGRKDGDKILTCWALNGWDS